MYIILYYIIYMCVCYIVYIYYIHIIYILYTYYIHKLLYYIICIYIYIYIYISIKFLQNACDHMLTPQCNGPLFLTPRDVGRFGVQNLTTGWSARIMSNHKLKIQRAMHQLEMKLLKIWQIGQTKRNHQSKINQQCISSIKRFPKSKTNGICW